MNLTLCPDVYFRAPVMCKHCERNLADWAEGLCAECYHDLMAEKYEAKRNEGK
jgi:hypothetical protein